MRSWVARGMESATEAWFMTREIVAGDRPRWSAQTLRVTRLGRPSLRGWSRPDFLLAGTGAVSHTQTRGASGVFPEDFITLTRFREQCYKANCRTKSVY